MFRPLLVYPLRKPRSLRAIAFLSVMTLWGGLSWAQTTPSQWGSEGGGASILVTDKAGDVAADQVRLVSGCSSIDCYANDSYWQSIGCRTCQTGGCGLGICAGLPCGDCGCCGSGCGVLGGCVTAGNLWSGYCGDRCGLKSKMSHAAKPKLLSSGSLGKLCGKGTDRKQVCNKCGDQCGGGCGGDGTFCGLPAPNYPVPFRTPAYVGYHQFTYPPMMPHNSLPHYRNVYSFRHGSGLERTTVNWQPSYIKNALRQIHHMFYLPR